jgi:hypothetical protein
MVRKFETRTNLEPGLGAAAAGRPGGFAFGNAGVPALR